MIDIHSHILPQIDDGSTSLEQSLEMVKIAVEQGITDIIATPHFLGIKEETIKAYNRLITAIKKEKIRVKIYLGQEIYYHKRIYLDIKNKALFTMNGSKYILLELDEILIYQDVEEIIYEVHSTGHEVVIAHLERYNRLEPKFVKQLKSYGALIQINAHSLFAEDKNMVKDILRLIKHGLVDFIASDQHSFRINKMKDAYKLVEENFGKEIANKLFIENAKKCFMHNNIAKV